MISPTAFVSALFDTFDKSARSDFQTFLARNMGIRKWMIAADYCLHDQDKPNSVFAFTIIPYDDYLHMLSSEIGVALPGDLKKTRIIHDRALAFLRDDRRFHFAFVFCDPPKVFNDGQGGSLLSIARASLGSSVDLAVEMERGAELVRRLKLLHQKSKAKKFNVQLLTDIYVLSYLFCFVTLAIARERTLDMVGWFSDRDSMTTLCDGVIWDISTESLYGLSHHLTIQIPKGLPFVAVPDAAVENGMWFDELIRLPDYIAGCLATWNVATNAIHSDKEKYLCLADKFFGPAENVAVIKVDYGDSVQCGRIVFTDPDAVTA